MENGILHKTLYENTLYEEYIYIYYIRHYMKILHYIR